jgi:hypothetical protein
VNTPITGAVLNTATVIEDNPTKRHPSTKESAAMLLYEDLARSRMREAERDAEQRRQANHLLAVKRWRRLAAWTARRAARAEERAGRR